MKTKCKKSFIRMNIFRRTALNKPAIYFINANEPANFSSGKGVKFAEQLIKTKSLISFNH